MGVMLRRVKVYGERKTGKPIGELQRGEAVQLRAIFPPDDCERFWGELASGGYVVVDAPRGRRVQILIGVDDAQ